MQNNGRGNRPLNNEKAGGEPPALRNADEPTPELAALMEKHAIPESEWPHDDDVDSECDDIDPMHGTSLCLSIEEQVLLALIDANPGVGSRRTRLNRSMRLVFGRPASGIPLPPDPSTGKGGEKWLRERALEWIAEEQERSKFAQLTGDETPAEKVRKLRDLKPASVDSIALLAVDKFLPTSNENRRVAMAKQLANDFFGYDQIKAAKKAAKKRAKAGGDPTPNIVDHPRTYAYQAMEHDYVADSLQTKAAIAVCKSLRLAGISVAHPDLE